MLGYLDDLIIVPLGIALAIRLIPAEVLKSCREQARQRLAEAIVIVVIWIAVLAAIAILVVTRVKRK